MMTMIRYIYGFKFELSTKIHVFIFLIVSEKFLQKRPCINNVVRFIHDVVWALIPLKSMIAEI